MGTKTLYEVAEDMNDAADILAEDHTLTKEQLYIKVVELFGPCTMGVKESMWGKYLVRIKRPAS